MLELLGHHFKIRYVALSSVLSAYWYYRDVVGYRRDLDVFNKRWLPRTRYTLDTWPYLQSGERITAPERAELS